MLKKNLRRLLCLVTHCFGPKKTLTLVNCSCSMRKGCDREKNKKEKKYQPSGEVGACLPPATPHRLQNPKWPPGGPKMAEGVWKGVYT